MSIHVTIGCVDADFGRALVPALRDEAARSGTPLHLECVGIIDVVSFARRTRPNILLIQDGGEPCGVDRLLQSMRQASADTRSVVMQKTCCDAQRLRLIRAGAFGSLLTTDSAATIAKAIRTVHAGEPWFTRAMLYEAIQRGTHVPIGSPPEESLTGRESEVLDLIGDGLTNKEIARRLNISDTTVKTHLHRVYVKLNKSGRYKAFRHKASEDRTKNVRRSIGAAAGPTSLRGESTTRASDLGGSGSFSAAPFSNA